MVVRRKYGVVGTFSYNQESLTTSAAATTASSTTASSTTSSDQFSILGKSNSETKVTSTNSQFRLFTPGGTPKASISQDTYSNSNINTSQCIATSRTATKPDSFPDNSNLTQFGPETFPGKITTSSQFRLFTSGNSFKSQETSFLDKNHSSQQHNKSNLNIYYQESSPERKRADLPFDIFTTDSTSSDLGGDAIYYRERSGSDLIMSSTSCKRKHNRSGEEGDNRQYALRTLSEAPSGHHNFSFLLKLRKTFSLDGIDLAEMKELVLQKCNEVKISRRRSHRSKSEQCSSSSEERRRRSFTTSAVDDLRRNGNDASSKLHARPFSYQARQETNIIVMKLAKTEQQLHESTERNKYLNEKLVEKGKQLEESRRELKTLQEKLEREIQCSGELYHKVKELERPDGIPTNHAKRNGDIHSSTDENENKISVKRNSFSNETLEVLENHLRKRSITPIGDLMLSCTLCNQRIKIEELESHSVKCSSGKQQSKPKNGKHTKNTAPQGMLVATVTCCGREPTTTARQPKQQKKAIDQQQPDEQQEPHQQSHENIYKVICKTTIGDFQKPLVVTERSKEDFLWFKKSLEALHPERVIPPLKFEETNDLTANLREIQRFLSRICAHKVLRRDTLVRKFFESSKKNLEKIKKNLEHRMPVLLKHMEPSVAAVDEGGILYKTKVYVNNLLQNLEDLIEFFNSNSTRTIDGLSKCFYSISEGESTDTYLKSITSSLSSIIGGLENKDNVIYDESVLAEDLESIMYLVYSADELLVRVQMSIETYLYWEEEIKVFEEMKTEGLVTASNGKDITHLWAEASSNCRTAKDELEKMFRDLSNELHEFDIRKEQELKQVLIEYAESRFDVFEKMQSKWFGVKLILESEIVPSVRAIDFTETQW